MSAKNFTEEFKIEAVKQINEQGFPVSKVAALLDSVFPRTAFTRGSRVTKNLIPNANKIMLSSLK